MKRNNHKGFDPVAKYYDFIAFLVFGNQIQKSQLAFLNKITKNARVLIVGGGTGWILNYIFRFANPSNLTYVESSVKMMDLSKQNVDHVFLSRINFVMDEDFVSNREMYDVVVTNYFMDVFQQDRLEIKMLELYDFLKPGGLWICTDFIDRSSVSLFNKLLVKSMYLFFRWTCQIEARVLPDIFGSFSKLKLQILNSELFYFKNIRSVLLQKI